MSDEGPKLFTHKPKKSKLKPSGMASSSSAGAAAPPPPPPPVKEPFLQRFKFYKTLVLVLSLTVGAPPGANNDMLHKRLDRDLISVSSPELSSSIPVHSVYMHCDVEIIRISSVEIPFFEST